LNFSAAQPWHRQGEHSKIQKPKRFWADAPFSTPQLAFLGLPYREAARLRQLSPVKRLCFSEIP
jgi:hypothetical protein